jgi:hypothetical protein
VGEGAVAWGQSCGAGAECAPGLLCVLTDPTPPTVSTCAKFCEVDGDCTAPGGLCILGLNDGSGGLIPDVLLCTEDCSPVTNVGCPIAGTACQLGKEQDGLGRLFTRCGPAGAGTQNAACATTDDCAAGYGCITPQGSNAVCLRWCNVAQPSCPGITTCVPLTIDGANVQIGAVQYGACL